MLRSLAACARLERFRLLRGMFATRVALRSFWGYLIGLPVLQTQLGRGAGMQGVRGCAVRLSPRPLMTPLVQFCTRYMKFTKIPTPSLSVSSLHSVSLSFCLSLFHSPRRPCGLRGQVHRCDWSERPRTHERTRHDPLEAPTAASTSGCAGLCGDLGLPGIDRTDLSAAQCCVHIGAGEGGILPSELRQECRAELGEIHGA